MPYILLLTATMIFIVRINLLRKLRRLPMKNGEDRFLGHLVGPGFYREVGVALLRRYRMSLAAPLLLDLPLLVWLLLTQRYEFILAALPPPCGGGAGAKAGRDDQGVPAAANTAGALSRGRASLLEP